MLASLRQLFTDREGHLFADEVESSSEEEDANRPQGGMGAAARAALKVRVCRRARCHGAASAAPSRAERRVCTVQHVRSPRWCGWVRVRVCVEGAGGGAGSRDGAHRARRGRRPQRGATTDMWSCCTGPVVAGLTHPMARATCWSVAAPRQRQLHGKHVLVHRWLVAWHGTHGSKRQVTYGRCYCRRSNGVSGRLPTCGASVDGQ